MTGSGGRTAVKLVGFATMNGGTTGGGQGQTVTATTYTQLKSYAESSTAYVIMVQGTISNGANGGSITISWRYLHDHHKGGLVGAADTDLYADRKVTFHHNYYKKVKLRVPMYRGATGHFFNNYIVGATDATEIRAGTCVRVEKNYYEALHYSIYTPSDSPGSTERIDNTEVSRTSRA